jgi:hypothetical protein
MQYRPIGLHNMYNVNIKTTEIAITDLAEFVILASWVPKFFSISTDKKNHIKNLIIDFGASIDGFTN